MDWMALVEQHQLTLQYGGAVLGTALLIWLLMRTRQARLQQIVDAQTKQIEASQSHSAELTAELSQANEYITALKAEVASVSSDNGHLLNRNDELKVQRKETDQQLQNAHNEISSLKAQLAGMEATRQNEKPVSKQIIVTKNKDALLKGLAVSKRVLTNAPKLKQTNQESIQSLLSPMQKELGDFKQRVDSVHSEETKQRAELKAELKQLQSLNVAITEQADKLSTALSGNKKMQGGWGEMILESVLDKSGLRLGQDYKREVTLVGDESKYRPDVVVYLPQNKHLVIDAKTSINAYQEYVNAEDEATRNTALKAHSEAVRARLNELADKEYFRLAGLNSPEVVIMFIPIESAYVEALKYDEQLFQGALERNVLIATPTTLLTSLNIVRQLWRFEDQNQHTVELASRAEKLYSKLTSFVESMSKVGRQIDSAKDTYDKAFNQLSAGKGNLIKQASEFKNWAFGTKERLKQ